jgi:ATP-dependent Lhr-like helicase
MDFPGLKRVLEEMEAGRCQLVARDTTEPSPLSHEVINAKPYAFLDDAPLEERRTQAVITRRGLDVKTADELGRLDQAAIDRVRDEAWPEAASADELHDALLVMGAVPIADCGLRNADWQGWFEELVQAGRATTLLHEPRLWVAAERVPLIEAVFPGVCCEPAVVAPERDRTKTWTREDALRELVRGRLEVAGPTTAEAIAAALGVPQGDVDFALGALEHEGFVLRGQFTPGIAQLEWCERRLLARIHRYTLDRLRQEIEPVSAADFMRFLLRWQRLTPDARAEGPDGLAAVLELLDGFEVPAGAWETDVLPARLAEYDPLWLDGLCLSGEIAWGRLSQTRNAEGGTRSRKTGPIRTTPVALFRRERGALWRSLVAGFRRRGKVAPFGVETAGRWSRVRSPAPLPEEQVAQAVAWQLLRRYGVVFRRLATRETLLVPWRDILRAYRRLEARGEIRGGRFVGGFSGEQYALPEAVGLLRNVRREQSTGQLVAVSGADPLNLAGIITPGDIVPALATNRILYRDGIPVAVREGAGSGERYLVEAAPDEQERLKSALVRGRVAPLVRAYLGRTTPRATSTRPSS